MSESAKCCGDVAQLISSAEKIPCRSPNTKPSDDTKEVRSSAFCVFMIIMPDHKFNFSPFTILCEEVS